jgi:hypothetical protein
LDSNFIICNEGTYAKKLTYVVLMDQFSNHISKTLSSGCKKVAPNNMNTHFHLFSFGVTMCEKLKTKNDTSKHTQSNFAMDKN